MREKTWKVHFSEYFTNQRLYNLQFHTDFKSVFLSFFLEKPNKTKNRTFWTAIKKTDLSSRQHLSTSKSLTSFYTSSVRVFSLSSIIIIDHCYIQHYSSPDVTLCGWLGSEHQLTSAILCSCADSQCSCRMWFWFNDCRLFIASFLISTKVVYWQCFWVVTWLLKLHSTGSVIQFSMLYIR